MKKPVIAAIALSLSATSYAWGEKEQAALLGLIIGGYAVSASQQRHHDSQPPVIIHQSPPQVILPYTNTRPQLIVDPNFIPRPPVYRSSVDLYVYSPPMIYDVVSRQWLIQSEIYIPGDKHYAGCNFYDYREAQTCIHAKEANRNYYAR